MYLELLNDILVVYTGNTAKFLHSTAFVELPSLERGEVGMKLIKTDLNCSLTLMMLSEALSAIPIYLSAF